MQVTWKELTFEATALHLAMIDEMKFLERQRDNARTRLKEDTQSLRLQLASAHEALGATIRELENADAWIIGLSKWDTLDMSAPTRSEFLQQLRSTIEAARAVLKQKEGTQ